MRKTVIASISLILAGCSQLGVQEPQEELQKEPQTVQLHYQCGTLPLSVTLDKTAQEVTFLLDGKQLNLVQVESASGAKYSNGQYTFWSKGRAAFIERGERIIVNDCVLN